MNRYQMTIRTADRCISYTAIGDRDALMDAAYDEHGVCGVTVRPA